MSLAVRNSLKNADEVFISSIAVGEYVTEQ
jgi:hypothetical protein